MKKVLISLAAVAALAACNKAEVVDLAPQTPITFANAFVDNATKTAVDNSYGSGTALTQFNVWGTVTGSSNSAVNIYNGSSVTGTVGANVWNCSDVQYWIVGAKYDFMAIAGVANESGVAQGVTVDDGTGMPTKITYNAETQKDVLFVKNATYTALANNSPVNFVFNHILSKVKFTVNNTTPTGSGVSVNTDYVYVVKDMKILNAPNTAEFIVANYLDNSSETNPWEVKATVADVGFGHATTTYATDGDFAYIAPGVTGVESHYERLVIPATYGSTNKLKVSFTVELYKKSGDTYDKINSDGYTKDIEVAFVPGYAYNFVINVGLDKPIEFKVTTNPGWTPSTPGVGVL